MPDHARPLARGLSELPECGQRLLDGKRCRFAPAWPANLLRTCPECAARTASPQLEKRASGYEDEEREAIMTYGGG